jgi:hypothetical protein
MVIKALLNLIPGTYLNFWPSLPTWSFAMKWINLPISFQINKVRKYQMSLILCQPNYVILVIIDDLPNLGSNTDIHLHCQPRCKAGYHVLQTTCNTSLGFAKNPPNVPCLEVLKAV